jgi:hypothetical protein
MGLGTDSGLKVDGGANSGVALEMKFDNRLREVMSGVRTNLGDMLNAAGDDAIKISQGILESGGHVLTGELKNAMQYLYESGGERGAQAVAIRVGSDHAAHVEFGVGAPGAKRTVMHAKAYPFVVPGLRFGWSNFKEKVNRQGILGER